MIASRARFWTAFVPVVAVAAAAGCAGEIGGANNPPPDAATAVDAPVDPIVCDPAGNCVGQVGAIKITGLDHEQASRVAAILQALPASLTRSAGFDIGRDPVSQVGCPDITRTPISNWPANCGYASVVAGTRLSLDLRDAALIMYPQRLDHVLTDFAARDWYLAHPDEVLATEHMSWTPCFPCPIDGLEPCWADDSQTPVVRVMRNFTSSVAATLLEDKAWDNGVRWTLSNAACSDPARIAAIEQRLVQDQPAPVVTRAIDIVASCPAGTTQIEYTLSTTSGTAPVTLAMIGDQGTLLFYLDKQATVIPPIQNIDLRAFERLVAFGTQQFELTLVRCVPPV